MDSIPSLQGINSQVRSSWSSLSCPSEPPDVGNWFSSYEYRSPDPDSNFSFQDSAFGRREPQRDEEKGEEEEANFENIRSRDEVVTGKKQVQCSSTCVEDDKHNEDLCLTKSLDSFSSGSLLSEPPDIRNWFSSYVYESSVSDTSSLFRDVVSQENEFKEERFDFKVINEDEGRFENVHPKPQGCVEHNSSSDENMKVKQPSSRGDGIVEMKKNLTTASNSHLEKILQPCMQDKTLQHSLGPTKYEETLSLNGGSPDCNRETHIMSLDTDRSTDYNCMRPPKLVNDIGEANSKAKIHHDKLDMSASLAKSLPARSPTCTRNKENDGFVTARKKKSSGANDESSWKKPEKMLLQCSTNTGTISLTCEKNGVSVTKRKALTEATNLQQSNGMEITGKWRCPQKGKPNLGPALKQLRLERWVRKV